MKGATAQRLDDLEQQLLVLRHLHAMKEVFRDADSTLPKPSKFVPVVLQAVAVFRSAPSHARPTLETILRQLPPVLRRKVEAACLRVYQGRRELEAQRLDEFGDEDSARAWTAEWEAEGQEGADTDEEAYEDERSPDEFGERKEIW